MRLRKCDELGPRCVQLACDRKAGEVRLLPPEFEDKPAVSSLHKVLDEHRCFAFDDVGNESVSQDEVFERAGRPIADAVLAGCSGCVFAYGQTGAGKT